MKLHGPILALDLSVTRTGWAIGAPGEVPQNGSVVFARRGFSLAAHFAGCREWLDRFHAQHNPRLVVFEAPLAPSVMEGRTNTTTVRALMGLAAMVEGTLYNRGIDVREASVASVRRFFLGSNAIKSADAKLATFRRCVELGFAPCNDDSADALALWCFMVSIVAPSEGVKLLPLFRKA